MQGGGGIFFSPFSFLFWGVNRGSQQYYSANPHRHYIMDFEARGGGGVVGFYSIELSLNLELLCSTEIYWKINSKYKTLPHFAILIVVSPTRHGISTCEYCYKLCLYVLLLRVC